MYTATECTSENTWNDTVRALNGHPLQLWGWGTVKSRHGWKVARILISREDGAPIAAAQVLMRPLPGPFRCLAYIPRGPVGAINDDEVHRTLERHIEATYRPVCLTVEPDTTEPITWKGWKRSSNRILLARTAVMNLDQSEEELLAQMSKKTRQYIRKSGGEGVSVRRATTIHDIDACLAIYEQTAERADFALHDRAYYHDIFTELKEDSPVFVAESDGAVVAFLWPIVTGEVAFELYGGMNDEGQRLRANYHLKWSVVQEMKRQGVHRYDVNGLLNDGVTSFKKGFIPEEMMMSGTFDKPMSPLYIVWAGLLPALKWIARVVRR